MTPDQHARHLMALTPPRAGLANIAFQRKLTLEIHQSIKSMTREELAKALVQRFEPSPLRNLLQDKIVLPEHYEVPSQPRG